MFGYIKPIAPELKVKEYELYKSVYCGLCSSLGRCTGCMSRMTLSYDFVFLALIRMGLSDEVGKIEHRRCLAHPLKKRSVMTNAPSLDYCAKMSALLTYHKLLDDISDERGFKRLRAYSLFPAAKKMRKRALPGLEQPDKIISEQLNSLAELEKEKAYSPDRAAEPFGELMATVFSSGLEASRERIASEIGRHIGRFIYIIDAADDLKSDLNNDSYNPFRIEGASSEAVLEEFNERKPTLKNALLMELIALERAVDLIEFESIPEYGSIVKNIIYLGLVELIDKTLGLENDQKTKNNLQPSDI